MHKYYSFYIQFMSEFGAFNFLLQHNDFSEKFWAIKKSWCVQIISIAFMELDTSNTVAVKSASHSIGGDWYSAANIHMPMFYSSEQLHWIEWFKLPARSRYGIGWVS